MVTHDIPLSTSAVVVNYLADICDETTFLLTRLGVNLLGITFACHCYLGAPFSVHQLKLESE